MLASSLLWFGLRSAGGSLSMKRLASLSVHCGLFSRLDFWSFAWNRFLQDLVFSM